MLLRFPPTVVCHAGCGVWGKTVSLPLPLVSVGSFYPLLGGGSWQLVVRSFSGGLVPHVAVDLFCLWDEGSSGSPCAAMLNCLLMPPLFSVISPLPLLCLMSPTSAEIVWFQLLYKVNIPSSVSVRKGLLLNYIG